MTSRQIFDHGFMQHPKFLKENKKINPHDFVWVYFFSNRNLLIIPFFFSFPYFRSIIFSSGFFTISCLLKIYSVVEAERNILNLIVKNNYMKTIRKNWPKMLWMILVSITLFTSCKDNPKPEPEYREEYVEEVLEPPVEGDVIEVIQGVTELSHFTMELGASDFQQSASENDRYTLFAPHNDVYPPIESTPGTDPSANDRSEVIFYHILQEEYSLEELQEIATSDSLPSVNTVKGEKIYLSMEEENKLILTDNSGQKAEITRTLPASNGVVHIINSTLLPPKKSE